MIESSLIYERIPRHIAIIMDGNGRWAQARGISRNEGHKKGLDALRSVVRSAADLGVRWLTLYAFSLENWNRPKLEVASLMGLLERYLELEIDEVMKKGIRLRSIGRPDRLPSRIRNKVDEAIERTRNNPNMTLVFALSYGGRSEIVDATRKLLRDAELGKIDPESVDEKTFAAYLYDPEAVNLAHPGSVALCEVVVDGHDVDAAPAERIQIGGECRDERLSLARLHLGDRASVEHDAADQLHVVVALSEGSLGGFAHGGERLGQEIVQGLALFETLPELARARAQRRIGELGTLRLEPVDPLDGGFELLDQPVVRAAEDLLDDAEHLRRAISRG